MTLWELAEPVSRLRGVGSAKAHDLRNLGVDTVLDLLLFAPRTYEDRRTPVGFADAAATLGSAQSNESILGSEAHPDAGHNANAGGRRPLDASDTDTGSASVPGTPSGSKSRTAAGANSHGHSPGDSVAVNTTASVLAHDYIGGRGGKRTLKVFLVDEAGDHASLVCFGRNFLAGKLVPGTRVRLYGNFSYRYGELQSTSFEFEPVNHDVAAQSATGRDRAAGTQSATDREKAAGEQSATGFEKATRDPSATGRDKAAEAHSSTGRDRATRDPAARENAAGTQSFSAGEKASGARTPDERGTSRTARPGRDFDRILPVYRLSGSLTQGGLRRLTETALAHYGANVVSTLPPELRLHGFATSEALRVLHFPEQVEQAEHAREALAFEEFTLLQLRIVRAAKMRRENVGRTFALPKTRRNTLIHALPFTLTDDQIRATEEIHEDMESSHPMHRLLQGDVGSGKTMVALLSAVACVEAGFQVALMAPTELLARQHADNAAKFLEPAGVRTAFLTGSLPKARRAPLLGALADGEVNLVVGTHALFTGEVTFANLKLAIIDEQQRFGVLQRAALEAKGDKTDVLVTTATPIPRTLALGLFGDLEISTIRTMPPGRKPVITHLARHGNEEKVYERVRSEIGRGRQAYFVYPLIEEGVRAEVRNATEMYETLAQRVFPDARVGLVHSRIAEEQKEATMAAFVRGELDILVATSVVEVGVDVANATCMVIEHAERFGLSALHQLRGRVGRSDKQSYCFLIYSQELTDAGKERMRVMHRTGDGFKIAEEDLRIRGPGNVAGTRQSGYVKLHIADLATDFSLLRSARDAAEQTVEKDPGLLEPAFQPLRGALSAFAEHMVEG